LVVMPSPGLFIAYKVLELSANYQPVISDFKLAKVVSFDATTCALGLKLSPRSRLISMGDWDGVSARRFELPSEGEDEPEGAPVVPANISVDFRALLDTRYVSTL